MAGQSWLPVDVRLVSATHQRLADLVQAGRFRADLYHRLQVVDIELPALRTHPQDIPALVRHFVSELTPLLGVKPIEPSPQVMEALQQYPWPGNVRELRNLVERSLILGAFNVSAPNSSHAQPNQHALPGPGITDLHTLEQQHIRAVLSSVGGNKSLAAQLLGVSRRTLERRVAEWGTAEAISPTNRIPAPPLP